MAKPKQKTVKTPKKRSTKYGKLAAVCSKELSAKKAALVRAEKAFAKAQKTHTELLAEVARLDMLDRSLKALINGTEPPQNVRYVYTYPQWVWYGNPYGWNGNWSVTLGAQGYSNFQGGQFTNSINTVIGDAPVISTTAGSLFTPSSTVYNCNTASLNTLSSTSGSLIGHNSSGITLDSAGSSNFSLTNAPGLTSFTTTNGPSFSLPELTVDLSTGAVEDVCSECGVETPEEGVSRMVRHDSSCSKLQTEAESIEIVAKAPKK